jgi:O-antigen ligase
MSPLLLWSVPVAILVAGIVRPPAALLIFAASLPLFGAPPGGPNLAVLDVSALIVVIVLWRAGAPARTPVDAPAACFLWVSLASLVPLAYHPPAWRLETLLGLVAALPGAERWSVFFTWRAAATALVGWLLFVAVRRLRGEAVAWLGGGLAVGLVVALALALGEWGGWIDLDGYRPIGREMFEDRLHSLFFNPAWFAQYLIAATPLAVVVLWSRSPRWRWVAGGLAAVSTLVAFRTLQRGAWFAVGLQVLLAASLVAVGQASGRARRRAIAVLAIGLVFASGTLIGAAVTSDHFLDALPRPLTDLSGRTAVWREAAEMMAQRPLSGWGIGSFSPVYDELHSESGQHQESWLTAHSLYLMIGAERGLLGLGAFGLVGVALFGALSRRLRSPDPDVARSAGAGLVAFAGLAFYGIVQYHFFIPAIEWLCWMVAGAAATLTAAGEGSPSSTVGGHSKASWASGGAVGFAQARHGGAAAKVLALVAAGVALSQWIGGVTVPARGDRGFGWHAPEVSSGAEFQWSAGRADLRLERGQGELVVPVANGHPRPKAHPMEVRLLLNGKEVDRFRPSGDWEERRLRVEEPVDEPLVLSIRTRPTFRPYQESRRLITLPPSRDLRLLGAAVGTPSWQPPASERAPAAGRRTPPHEPPPTRPPRHVVVGRRGRRRPGHLATSIVQREEIEPAHLDSAFWAALVGWADEGIQALMPTR